MRPVEALSFDLNSTLLEGSGIPKAILRTCAEVAAARPGLEAARLLEANNAAWRAYWPEVRFYERVGYRQRAIIFQNGL